jgi:hypothetical protein
VVLKSTVFIGFFMDPEIHRLSSEWCKKQGCSFESFCSIAVSNYFLQLAAVAQPIQIAPAPKSTKKGA